jgi:hypothetical protein
VLGVLALVVALALLAGFQKHVRARLAAETPHLTLEPLGRDAVRESEGLEKELRARPDVTRLSVVARGRVWLSYGDSSVPAIAVGRTDADGLALTASQARDLGVFEGDTGGRVFANAARLWDRPDVSVPPRRVRPRGGWRRRQPGSFSCPRTATAYSRRSGSNAAPRIAAEAALAATRARRRSRDDLGGRQPRARDGACRFAFATVFIVFVAGSTRHLRLA